MTEDLTGLLPPADWPVLAPAEVGVDHQNPFFPIPEAEEDSIRFLDAEHSKIEAFKMAGCFGSSVSPSATIASCGHPGRFYFTPTRLAVAVSDYDKGQRRVKSGSGLIGAVAMAADLAQYSIDTKHKRSANELSTLVGQVRYSWIDRIFWVEPKKGAPETRPRLHMRVVTADGGWRVLQVVLYCGGRGKRKDLQHYPLSAQTYAEHLLQRLLAERLTWCDEALRDELAKLRDPQAALKVIRTQDKRKGQDTYLWDIPRAT